MTPSEDGRRLVFLLGSPRSGTTWLQNLLTASPSVHTGPESYFFAHYVGRLIDTWNKEKVSRLEDGMNFLGLSSYLTNEQFNEKVVAFAQSLIDSITSNLKPGEIFLEKTPLNAIFTREIMTVFPECRVIHIIRDPRDVVASILRTARVMQWRLTKPDARSAARLWRFHVRAVKSALNLATRERFLEVRYEELYAKTEPVVGQVLDFIGAPYRKEDLARAIDENRAEAVREGRSKGYTLKGEAAKDLGPVARLPRDFVGKAVPGSWERNLSQMEKFWVWYIAGELMKECGYDWDVPWWYLVTGRIMRAFRPQSQKRTVATEPFALTSSSSLPVRQPSLRN